MHLNFNPSLILPLLLNFYFIDFGTCDNAADFGDVVFVNILFRHGNRTPVQPYPTDPYKNISYWPTGWGQLTKEGMMGHYLLGKWFRQRYSSLLSDEYDRSDIFVQSTDVDRTLMSAYSNLAGLYEPSPAKNWDPDIKWRPIPVHTIPEVADLVKSNFMVLAGKKNCPKYKRLLKALLESKKFKQILDDNKYLMETISNATGSNVNDLESLEYIYNTLSIETMFKFALPSWTETVYPEPLKSLADLSFAVSCYTPELARLKIGPLLKEMIVNMEEKASGKLNPDRKVWMYSAHDTTVANLLQALKTFNFLSPPYFSTILIELRKKSANHYVTVYFRNSSLEEPHLLTVPGCSELCPLDNFVKILQPVLPEDWERECHLSLQDEMHDFTSVGIIVYVASATAIILLIVISFQMCRRQNPAPKGFIYSSLSVDAN